MKKTCRFQIKSQKLKVKSSKLFNYLLIGLFVYLVTAPSALAASPHLELSPASGTISASGTNIEVKIDTGSQESKSAKAVIKFDSTLLEVVSVTAGTFFDEVSHNIYNSSGEVVINANLSLGSSLESKTGTGTLATLTIKAKASSGTANMTFDCTSGSSTDSGINDPTPTDIIDCTANVNGSYSLGGTAVSPSPSPAIGGPQPSASVLPVAGNIKPTFNLLFLGFGLILLSVPLFLFV